MKDTHGNNLTGLGNLFSQGAYVSVVLNTEEQVAYLQNAATNGYLEGKIGQLSNPNLLINGDFRVNQRGATKYPTADPNTIYTVDRWFLPTMVGTQTLEIKDGGVLLTGDMAQTNTATLSQRIEKLESGVYTISAKVDGEVRSHTFVFEQEYVDKIYSDGFFFAISVASGIPAVGFGIRLSLKNQALVEWVKFEKGSFATPFVPKTYAEEWVACQRYHQKAHFVFTYMANNAATANTGRLWVRHQLTKMRSNPTVTGDVYDDNAQVVAKISAYDCSDEVLSWVRVTADLPKGNYFVLAVLDAEL
jgi:hypothetical protein